MANNNFSRRIIFHNTENVIKAINLMNEGEKPFAELNSSDFEIRSFDIPPIEGFLSPQNPKTGELFPECCNYHSHIFKISKEWFGQFPDCCDAHRKLHKATWFKRENYQYVALKIVTQLEYTLHQIKTQIANPDWYKDITDYIHYNVSSFGQLPSGNGNPVGLHIYISHLKHWVKDPSSDIPMDKREKLVECLDEYYMQSTTSYKTDLNVLYLIYQKWLRVFPFTVSYFSEQQQYFSKQLPIVAGQAAFNKYAGTTSIQIQTQAGLIEALTNKTKELLRNIDAEEWIKKGLIINTNKHKLQLLNASHRIKQSNLVDEFTEGEMKYIHVLEKWLDNERNYFTELMPLAKSAQLKGKEYINENLPKTFNELFPGLKTEVIEMRVAILKNAKPQVIDENYEFRLEKKFKGAIVAWVDVMQEKGGMNKDVDSKRLAALLKDKITGLDMGDHGRSFKSKNIPFTRQYKAYKNQFERLLRTDKESVT